MKLLDRNAGDQELDQLLGAFFQSELPQPFPALKLPESRPALRWTAARSKLALAASVGLLLLGGWLLAGSGADFTPPTNLGGGSGAASRPLPGKTTPAKNVTKTENVKP